MKFAFLSDRSYGSTLKLLKTSILIPELPLVDSKTAYHADLSLCILGNDIVCAPSLYERFEQIKSPDFIGGFNFIKGSCEPREPYPNDILYNAAVVGKYVFCKKDSTDKKLLEIAELRGYQIIDVKQGYARCSTLPVSDTALITSDNGICSAALDLGLDVLQVTNEGVSLDGYPNGFIGGCGGFFENKLIFSGDISKHRDYGRIKDFCEKYCVEVLFTDEPLYDFGSILC